MIACLLVDQLNSKIELRIKHRSLQSLGEFIAQRTQFPGQTIKIILEAVQQCFSNEAIQYESILTLKNFSKKSQNQNNSSPQNLDIKTQIDNLVTLLIHLFDKKTGLFQVGVIDVIDSLHKDPSIQIEESQKMSFMNKLFSYIKEDNLFLARIISKFFIENHSLYQNVQGFDICYQNYASLISSVQLEVEFITLIQKLFLQISDEGYLTKFCHDMRGKQHKRIEQVALLLDQVLRNEEEDQLLGQIVEELVLKTSVNCCLSFHVIGHVSSSKDMSRYPKLADIVIQNCRAKDIQIKKSAIKAAVGLLFMSGAEFLIEELKNKVLNEVESRLFFFGAVTSIFENFETSEEVQHSSRILDLVDWLLDQINETERSSAYKAVGKILRCSRTLISSKLLEYHNKGQVPLMQLVAVACRYIFKRDNQLVEFGAVFELLLEYTRHADYTIQSESFTSLDSILHYQPEVYHKLDLSFMENMSQKMVFSKESLKVVKMGQITYREDQGLPVRKICFQILNR